MGRWWSLVVAALLGCEAREKVRPVAAPVAKRPFEVKLVEVAVDHPIYPDPPPGTRILADAGAIRDDVDRTVRRELDRIAACVNQPVSAAIQVWGTLGHAGRVVDVRASATLTSPGQDPARDRCIADVIGSLTFSQPDRIAPIELALGIDPTDD